MLINYKLIVNERCEDAPFIGALISACDCNFNCVNCCNQHVKNMPTLQKDDINIINEVLLNPFNKGIILAGLEWTLQPREMLSLINLALKSKLKVILYTGMDIELLKNHFSQLLNLPIYIKYGRYKKDLHTEDYKMYGVKLASSNQKIIKCGETNET